MRHLKMTAFLVLSCLAGVLCVSGCVDDAPGNDDALVDALPDEDGAVDADAGDAAGDAETADASPGVTQYDFCGQEQFMLPPAPTEDILSVASWGRYVATARWLDPSEHVQYHDIFLFDLEECKEYVVCAQPGIQAGAYVHGGTVFWGDFRYNSGGDDRRTELFSFDVETWEELRLTDDPEAKAFPKYNGRHVVYKDSTGATQEGRYGLTLWDLQTDEHTTLATWQAAPEFHAISERYVAWTAYSLGEPGYGKDVFYHDLQTGESTRIQTTGLFDIRVLDLSGDRILWMENDSDHYNIILYEIGAEEEVRLTDDGFDHMAPRLRGNLAMWITYKYSGGSYATDPARKDLVLYDLDTGVERRITSESVPWGTGYADPPWMWYVKVLAPYHFEIHVVNLPMAGLVDANGNVIPE